MSAYKLYKKLDIKKAFAKDVSIVIYQFSMNESHCYIVSFDLCMPGRNYESLYQTLKRFGQWGKLTESTWAVVSEMNHVQIRDYLMQYLDKNDRLVVVLSGKAAAWNRVMAENQWVRENIVK